MRGFLIYLSIFLTLYKFDLSALTVTYSDAVFVLLVLLFLKDLVDGRLRFPRFAQDWLFYILILLFSGLVNLTFLEGPFLNIFKTYCFSFVLFVMVYSYIQNGLLRKKMFLIYSAILLVAFMIKTWTEMQANLLAADVEFTSVGLFDSSLNLNTWGFILVLFLVQTLYFAVTTKFKNLAIIIAGITLIFIFFSYSRTAYTLALMALLWTFLYVDRGAKNTIVLPLILLGVIYLGWNIWEFNISEDSLSFLERKSTGYGDDLVNTRFQMINILPLEEHYSEFNIINIVVGDGISIQHSFLSHTLIVTGILGFIVYVRRFWSQLAVLIENIKRRLLVKESKMLVLLLLIILINDFITNISAYLPFSAYLGWVIAAFILADMGQLKKTKI